MIYNKANKKQQLSKSSVFSQIATFLLFLLTLILWKV